MLDGWRLASKNFTHDETHSCENFTAPSVAMLVDGSSSESWKDQKPKFVSTDRFLEKTGGPNSESIANAMAFSLARFHVAMSIWNILSPFNFMFWGFVFWACTLWKMVDPWIHLCWLVSKKWHRHHSAGQPLNLDPAKVVRNKSRSSIFPSSLSLLYYIYIYIWFRYHV